MTTTTTNTMKSLKKTEIMWMRLVAYDLAFSVVLGMFTYLFQFVN